MQRAIVCAALILAGACDNAPIKNMDPMLMEPDEPRGDPLDSGVIAMSGDTGVPSTAHPDATVMEPHDGGVVAQNDASEMQSGLELSGVWAFEQVTSQIVDAPFSGMTITQAHGLSRIEITQNGMTLSLRAKVCTLQLDPIGSVQTIYPQTAIEALPIVEGRATLDRIAIGAMYTTEPGVALLGWASATPATDTLPANADDQRVRDADHDGYPGVTLQVTGLVDADVYVVNRTTASYSGTIISAERIEGLNDTLAEQVILDSTSRLVPRGPLSSMRDPDPNASRFRMVRLGEGTPNTCADIAANRATLFP